MSEIESVVVGCTHDPNADQLHAWRSIWRLLLRPATSEAKPGLIPPEPYPATPWTSSSASPRGQVDAPLGTSAGAQGNAPGKDSVRLAYRRARDRPTASNRLLPLERPSRAHPFAAQQGQGGDR